MKTIPPSIEAGILNGSLAVVPVLPSAEQLRRGTKSVIDGRSPTEIAGGVYDVMLVSRPDHLRPEVWPEAEVGADASPCPTDATPAAGTEAEWKRSCRALIEAAVSGYRALLRLGYEPAAAEAKIGRVMREIAAVVSIMDQPAPTEGGSGHGR